MDKRSFALFILLLLGASFSSRGQALHCLNLQQALDVAAKRNKEIKRSGLMEKLAEEEFKEQKERQLPEVDFHASYARITDLTSFPTGFKQVVVDQTIPEWADITATARIPLYEGGAIKYRIHKAEQELKITKIKMEMSQDDIKIEVIANFLGIFKLMELQKLIQENINEERDRLQEVRTLRKYGTVTTNEVLRAEVQLSDMEVRLMANKHHINVALHQLHTLLELPEDERLQIDTTQLLSLSMPKLQDRDVYMTYALNKDEMRIVAEKQGISKTNVRLVRSHFFPKISLFGSYAGNYPNYMGFPPVANPYTYGKIGLEAAWQISGLYKNKTKVHIAQLDQERQNVDADILKNHIQDKVYSGFSQLEELHEKLPVIEHAQKQAAENYRIVKVKYLHQLALITDIIDADNALQRAKFNVISTKIDAIMKHYELRYAAGLL